MEGEGGGDRGQLTQLPVGGEWGIFSGPLNGTRLVTILVPGGCYVVWCNAVLLGGMLSGDMVTMALSGFYNLRLFICPGTCTFEAF